MRSHVFTGPFGFLIFALSSGCATTHAPAPPPAAPRVAVQSFGTMHATMTGGAENTVSRVGLDEVRAEAGAIALGTAVGLDGEITVYGKTIRAGHAWIAPQRGHRAGPESCRSWW